MTNINDVKDKTGEEQKSPQNVENSQDVSDNNKEKKDCTTGANEDQSINKLGFKAEVYEWIKSHPMESVGVAIFVAWIFFKPSK